MVEYLTPMAFVGSTPLLHRLHELPTHEHTYDAPDNEI